MFFQDLRTLMRFSSGLEVIFPTPFSANAKSRHSIVYFISISLNKNT
jgi:hypothetical protein